jgi:hypothetical protein
VTRRLLVTVMRCSSASWVMARWAVLGCDVVGDGELLHGGQRAAGREGAGVDGSTEFGGDRLVGAERPGINYRCGGGWDAGCGQAVAEGEAGALVGFADPGSVVGQGGAPSEWPSRPATVRRSTPAAISSVAE